jgi:hypothetical protein
MTPTRYRECLDFLGLSQRGLAPILRCAGRLTRSWATGREVIYAWSRRASAEFLIRGDRCSGHTVSIG